MRAYTLESINLAIYKKLLTFDNKESVIIPLQTTQKFIALPKDIDMMHKSSEKLGFMCAQLNDNEISLVLRLEI